MTDREGAIARSTRSHDVPLRTPAASSPGTRPTCADPRGHTRTGIAIATPIENLLRGLLGANGRRDAGARVAEGARSLLGAEWAALLEHDGRRWVCRSASGKGARPGSVWTADPAAPSDSTGLAPFGAPSGSATFVDPSGVPSSCSFTLETPEVATVLVVGPPAGGNAFDPQNMELLSRVISDLGLALRRGEELDTLRSQAFVDALTECYNRRGFDEHLHVELLRAQRYERSAALMLVDLDHFKEINDRFGHQAGDHLLRIFAGLLNTTFRTTDIVSRYGGDEFAVIFPETTTEEAARLAERLRLLLLHSFPDPVVPRPITASFGVASYPRDATHPDTLIAASDRALYVAKMHGRDRVVAAAPAEERAE